MPRFSLLLSETPLHLPRLLQETCVSRRCLCVHSTQCVPMIRSFKSQHLHSESIDSDILLLVMHNSFTTHQVLLCNNHVSPAHAVMKFYDLLFHPVDILQRMQGNTSNCCFPCSESAGSHSPWSVAYFRKAILMATSIEVDPLSEKKTLSAHPATNGQTSKSQPIDQFSFVAG